MKVLDKRRTYAANVCGTGVRLLTDTTDTTRYDKRLTAVVATTASLSPDNRIVPAIPGDSYGFSEVRKFGVSRHHSHSMVAGGLLVTSSTTRLMPRHSLVMRVEMVASTSYGTRDQSAVIASSELTGRSTIGEP